MDKRFFLALFLSLIVIAISQLLFPSSNPKPSRQGAVGNDSISGMKTSASSTQPLSVQSPEGQAPVPATLQGLAAEAPSPNSKAQPATETTAITTPKVIYKFSNVGAAPVSIVIRDYKNRWASGGLVDLGGPGSPLLSYQLVTPTDTAGLA